MLVGYDGSAAADDAVALSVPLARMWRGEIHVVTTHAPVVLGGRNARARQELRAARLAEQGMDLVAGGARARSSDALAAAAVQGLRGQCHEATLCTVVGRPRHRLRRRPSVTHGVLSGGSTPVAVPRRGLADSQPAMLRLVLGIDARLHDLADNSRGAGIDEQFAVVEQFARALAPPAPAELHLCAIVDGTRSAAQRSFPTAYTGRGASRSDDQWCPQRRQR